MSKRDDKVEFSSDDEIPEVLSSSRTKGNVENVRRLGDKEEYVEVDEQTQSLEEKSRRKSEDSLVFSFLSRIQHSWMLNVTLTDESEEACARFLSVGGLYHFMACYDEDPNDEDLVALMLATISNVSEHVRLRPDIMDNALVPMISNLLERSVNVSECAASILCKLASDGPDAWTVKNPTRGHVLAKVEKAIDGWNPKTQSQFNYRTLQPILNLLQVQGTSACQKYALWILDNLLYHDILGKKYLNLLKEEGGISILKSIVEKKSNHPEYIKARATDLLQKIS